ncbi:MAG: hypothetical protein GY679_01305 [Mycoplasma sp.]|nr:hypothetical protein [Mycoplasma sp.]
MEVKPIENIDEKYIFDISDEPVVFTLESFSNKERPVEAQMRITMKPLSAKDVDAINRKVFAEVGQRNKMNEDEWQAKYMTVWLKYNFKEKIEGLENIYFKINGHPKQITDPNELYCLKDNKATTIVTEIKNLMSAQDSIEEEEEKN